MARQPSWYYRAKCLVRRRRLIFVTILGIFMAFSVATTVNYMESKRARIAEQSARYQAEKAMAINSFLTNDFMVSLLDATNNEDSEHASLPKVERIKNRIENASISIPSIFGNRPSLEAGARNEVGTLYYNLGYFIPAEMEFRRAYELWSKDRGEWDIDTISAMNNLGQALMNQRRFDEAEPIIRLAVQRRTELMGNGNVQTINSMNNLAELLRQAGRLEESVQSYRILAKTSQESLGRFDKTTITVMANLGSILVKMGSVTEGLEIHRDVYERSQIAFGPRNMLSLQAADRLAQTCLKAALPEEALQLLVPTVSAYEEILGSSNRNTVIAKRLLARTLVQLNRQEEAMDSLEKLLETLRQQPHDTRMMEMVEKDLQKIRNEDSK